jgi:uncharacterized protein YjbI with pentapeptide repeats
MLAADANDMTVWNEWRGENPDIIPDLTEANLREANLDGTDLGGVNFAGANLYGATLSGANLSNANLTKTDLGRADLSGADLTRADLSGAKLTGASLSKADLIGARLVGAQLIGAHLKETKLISANLSGAALTWADLRESDFTWADLRDADLGGANFENANVTGVRFNRWSRYRGIRIATTYGSPAFKRFAQDQEYIEELRGSSLWGKLAYLAWLIFADCGRSLLVWTSWCVVAVLVFAFRFWSLGAEAFRLADLPWEPGTALYYSVVTFTILGMGNVAPRTAAAVVSVTIEVILGYLMLAGLISILTSKLARRS